MKLLLFLRWARKVLLLPLRKYRTRAVQRRREANAVGPIRLTAHLKSDLASHIIGLTWLKSLSQKGEMVIHVRGDVEMTSFLTSGGDAFISDVRKEPTLTSLAADVRLVLGALVHIPYINMAKISSRSPELAEAFTKIILFSQRYQKYIKYAPRYDGAWSKMCVKVMEWNQWTALGANGAVPCTPDSLRALTPVAADGPVCFGGGKPHEGAYITIHGDDSAGWAPPRTGQWPLEHWIDFCRWFKAEHPDVAIVQIGFGAGQVIPGTDWNIAGQKSLAELALILKNSALHIDGDSGLVHLKALLDGRSVVLFGPTVAGYAQYPGNYNVVSEYCGECMEMLREWRTKCVAGHPRAECMWRIDPETVYQAVSRGLAGRLNMLP
jgi:hypothetical protein